METRLSLASILSSLEAQIAHPRGQESLHAERETFLRGRRAQHAAELEQLIPGRRRARRLRRTD
jgi:hypothetical protein